MRTLMLDEAADPERAIVWNDDRLLLLDQRVLPAEELFVETRDARETADAIRAMVVRGAPAIGITAAYGVVLSVMHRLEQQAEQWFERVKDDLDVLAASRPTAVNLFWALDRMKRVVQQTPAAEQLPSALVAEARALLAERHAPDGFTVGVNDGLAAGQRIDSMPRHDRQAQATGDCLLDRLVAAQFHLDL